MNEILKKLNKRSSSIHSVFEDIKTNSFPILSSKESHSLISSINYIYGLRSLSREDIIDYLIRNKLISRVKNYSNLFYFPDKKYDIFDLTHTKSRSSYFSHYSAVYIHNLTEQIPKNIYLTYERPTRTYQKSNLSQNAIDIVFNKPPRIASNNIKMDGYNIYYLNGQAYDRIGLERYREMYLVTDLERTLIDITVKPFYSGGVTQILEAYHNSKELIDVEKLLKYYTKMNFTYPYHQAIGFYLQKVGISDYKLFKYFNRDFKFYLTYNILHQEFSDEWNIIYPKGI